jgi:uncharacterized protein
VRRLAAFALVALVACGARKSADATPPKPQPRVVVETAAGARHAVDVELARTQEEQRQGLMHRQSLPPDAGMLFVFDREQDHAFWMENTLIPLDMIFVDDEGGIVGIVENAEPLTRSPRRVDGSSRFVLEVNGGWSKAHGVAKGDRVRFENVPRF